MVNPADDLSAAPPNPEEFRLIAERAPVVIWATRADGRTIFVNRCFSSFTGLAPEGALDFDWRTILHPDDAAAVIGAAERGCAARGDFTVEARVRNAEGEWRWLHAAMTPRMDAAGAFAGYIGVAHDLTDRKQIELALREREAELRKSEESLRLAIEDAGMATWELDLTTLAGEWSANRFDLFGMPRRADGRGSFQDWLDRIHPEDRPRAEAAARRCFDQGTPYTIEYRILRADTGGERWLQSHGTRVDYSDGRPTRFVGVSFDITEAKRAEARLRASETRFRTIFEQANDFLITTDLDQRITSVNPAVEHALGYAQAEMVGRSIGDFMDAGDFARSAATFKAGLARCGNGGSTRLTLHVLARDGRRLVWETNSQITVGPDGVPTGLHAICRDVTEAKRAEAHLRLLIDELNHRVKNTLAIVQGIAQQSFRRGVEPEAGRRAFEGRLAALSEAHNLLTRQQWTPVSMRRIIADAVAPHGGDEGRFTLDGPDLMIAPKTAISLALAIHELATNAVKHGALSASAGRVAIDWSVTGADDTARLVLRWTESGGPPVEVPRHRGFGTRMIERGLAAELGGAVTIAFRQQGLVCTVEAPLPQESRSR